MSICIKPDLLNIDKIILTDETEFIIKKEETNFSVKKRNLLYKYDFNICKELHILTNYIDVLKYTDKYNKLKFIINNQHIVDVYNLIQHKINTNFNINNQETNEILVSDQKYIELCFINNISELILHPSKKSNLLQYNLTKTENSNEIKRYFPSMSKYNIDDTKNIHTGKFLLKFDIINNKLKCIIINGELKYNKSHIQSEMKSKNIYKSNIMIEL